MIIAVDHNDFIFDIQFANIFIKVLSTKDIWAEIRMLKIVKYMVFENTSILNQFKLLLLSANSPFGIYRIG